MTVNIQDLKAGVKIANEQLSTKLDNPNTKLTAVLTPYSDAQDDYQKQ